MSDGWGFREIVRRCQVEMGADRAQIKTVPSSPRLTANLFIITTTLERYCGAATKQQPHSSQNLTDIQNNLRSLLLSTGWYAKNLQTKHDRLIHNVQYTHRRRSAWYISEIRLVFDTRPVTSYLTTRLLLLFPAESIETAIKSSL